MDDPVLTIDALTAGYEQAAVIRDVDITVAAGEVVALFGANGAGKTTTLRVVSGLVKPMSGRILFAGEDLARTSPSARARLGIAHVPEGRGLFFGMTVAEHFRVGPRGERLDDSLAYDYFPKLAELKGRRVGLLSGGEQQMLARRPGPGTAAEADAARRAQSRARAGDRRAASAGGPHVRDRARVRGAARRAARASGARRRGSRLRPLARAHRAPERRGAPAGAIASCSSRATSESMRRASQLRPRPSP